MDGKGLSGWSYYRLCRRIDDRQVQPRYPFTLTRVRPQVDWQRLSLVRQKWYTKINPYRAGECSTWLNHGSQVLITKTPQQIDADRAHANRLTLLFLVSPAAWRNGNCTICQMKSMIRNEATCLAPSYLPQNFIYSLLNPSCTSAWISLSMSYNQTAILAAFEQWGQA